MTQLFADFELSLHRRDAAKTYTLEGRLSLPNDDADQRFGLDQSLNLKYDPLDFENLIEIPEDYGTALAEHLFQEEPVREMWAAVNSAAKASGATLRLRLLIGPSASELNSIYWETLRDPQDSAPLFTSERLLFSRYLSAQEMRPVNLRPQGNLRALIFVANPSDLADYKLAAVDTAGEIARAKESLAKLSIPPVVISSQPNQRASLNALMEGLRAGFDIVYFVAHGTLANGEPFLWLENEAGKSERIAATQLALRMRELAQQPRLLVLASCQSAGKGNGATLQAFGPRLAQAGIPAVLAMQGNISMESVKEFMPVFFEELLRDGQIDRALAVARGSIRAAHDWWMPVLFMRLKSGKIWYVPGVGGDGNEFDKWPVVFSGIEADKCTPVLGPGLLEPLTGSWNEITASLAAKYNFPLASFYSDALPQVAQYIFSHFDPNTLSTSLEGQLRTSLIQRFASDLPDTLKSPHADLLKLITASGTKFRERDQYEPHQVLANLPIRIYITTNYDDLMTDNLKQAGKDPQRVLCPWNNRFEEGSIYDNEPDYQPSVERPLVYHLFGHFSQPESMVLTEDNYYEFLISFTTNKKRTPPIIPPAVLRALADSTLLVLGFHLDDWAFRSLFRTLMVPPGGARPRSSHVGIQIEPDETNTLSPQKAHKYLEKYFGDAATYLYWGKSQDFLRQLAEKRATA